MAYERSFEAQGGSGWIAVATGDPRRFADVDKGRVGRVYIHVDVETMSYEDATRLANALLEIAATARHHSKG